jgi:hypothetical protein
MAVRDPTKEQDRHGRGKWATIVDHEQAVTTAATIGLTDDTHPFDARWRGVEGCHSWRCPVVSLERSRTLISRPPYLTT